ncbi:MAG: glycosyltransferase family 9 protein [Akkermansiaceae bacterium]|nr:glycosyltransferase family 9 protein [Akkermansiaceae bacterium]
MRENFETPALRPPPEQLQIAIAPASGYGPTYQWPLERFKEVVDMMDQRYADIEWVILGQVPEKSKDDRCAELDALLEGRARNFSGIWDLDKILHALPYCTALLSCDSEMAHMAAHVGLPTAVIFGPNEPEWKRPLGRQNRVVREHVACSPCYLTKCPLDMRCQKEVTADMVVAELETAMAVRHA